MCGFVPKFCRSKDLFLRCVDVRLAIGTAGYHKRQARLTRHAKEDDPVATGGERSLRDPIEEVYQLGAPDACYLFVLLALQGFPEISKMF